jgi:uncharacterized phage protein gp47/JayE
LCPPHAAQNAKTVGEVNRNAGAKQDKNAGVMDRANVKAATGPLSLKAIVNGIN